MSLVEADLPTELVLDILQHKKKSKFAEYFVGLDLSEY